MIDLIYFYLHIKISVPLHPPPNLRIGFINGTSANIHWDSLKPVDQGGFVTNYKIMYHPLSSPDSHRIIDYSNNQSSISYTLTNLDGYTNYSCSISACTSR